MKKIRCFSSFFLLLAFFVMHVHALDECLPAPGIYRNNQKFVIISQESQPVKAIYRLFYSYYYDAMDNEGYTFESDEEPFCCVQIQDKLYTQYWIRYDTGNDSFFWCPEGNMTDISVTPSRRNDVLYGYGMISSGNEGEQDVFRISYWKTDCEYSEKSAQVWYSDSGYMSVPMFIKIGSIVYKCVSGQNPRVRNVSYDVMLPEDAVFSDSMEIMAAGKYYEKVSEEMSMKDEILYHNSIIYPPHFAAVDIIEPSIYSQLEEMEIK